MCQTTARDVLLLIAVCRAILPLLLLLLFAPSSRPARRRLSANDHGHRGTVQNYKLNHLRRRQKRTGQLFLLPVFTPCHQAALARLRTGEPQVSRDFGAHHEPRDAACHPRNSLGRSTRSCLHMGATRTECLKRKLVSLLFLFSPTSFFEEEVLQGTTERTKSTNREASCGRSNSKSSPFLTGANPAMSLAAPSG